MSAITHGLINCFCRRKGQSTVEFALVLPLLLILLMGIIDYGYLFYEFQSVQNASRVAARSAAVLGWSDSDATEAGKATLPDGVRDTAVFTFSPPSPNANGRTSGINMELSVAWSPVSLTGFFGPGGFISGVFPTSPAPVVINETTW